MSVALCVSALLPPVTELTRSSVAATVPSTVVLQHEHTVLSCTVIPTLAHMVHFNVLCALQREIRLLSCGNKKPRHRNMVLSMEMVFPIIPAQKLHHCYFVLYSFSTFICCESCEII